MSWSSALRALRSDFVWEWRAVFLTVVLDCAWAQAIHFHLLLSWESGLMVLGFGGVYAATRLWLARLALMVDYVCLSLAGSMALIVFSYLCLASAPGPLIDNALLAGDRALGFDWLALYHEIMRHPLLSRVLQLAYDSLLIQGLYCMLLLGLMRQRDAMAELWRLTFTISVICCLSAIAFPALGPYKLFGLETQGIFLPDMERLLSHRDLHFALGDMTGVICFPSLHTAMGLAYPYGLRRAKPIFFLFAALNAVMLCAIPFFGGHYLMDMVAGAAVMLLSVMLTRWMAKKPAAPVLTLAEEGI